MPLAKYYPPCSDWGLECSSVGCFPPPHSKAWAFWRCWERLKAFLDRLITMSWTEEEEAASRIPAWISRSWRTWCPFWWRGSLSAWVRAPVSLTAGSASAPQSTEAVPCRQSIGLGNSATKKRRQTRKLPKMKFISNGFCAQSSGNNHQPPQFSCQIEREIDGARYVIAKEKQEERGGKEVNLN